MEIVIAFVFFAIGVAIGLVIRPRRPIGDLRVDRSDPTSTPYLFLELDTDVHAIMSKKYATFRVKVENFIPHE